jgi:integrase
MYTLGGKRRVMGLGGYPSVSLKDARRNRDEAEKQLQNGKDPSAERQVALPSEPQSAPTFGEMAEQVITSKESQWRNAKHRAQWSMTLDVYAAPLKDKPVDEITTVDVLAVLKPLWLTKQETASRLRGRIEAVLDAAKALKHRSGENPAAWKGNLTHLLARPSKLARGHQTALAYNEIPEFFTKLQAQDNSVATLALEFTILTAARTSETLGAKWAEFDVKNKVWVVPAVRTKTSKEHRVPLSNRCIEILASMGSVRDSEYAFLGMRKHQPLSNMAMLMLLRRMNRDVTVHGFRSSFRDWAGNETHYPRELIEEALSHLVGNEVERAYRRSDAIEKRRMLMNDWAAFCLGKTTSV